MNNQQRNDLCACGSGKKYKNCCMRKDEAKAQLSKQQYDIRQVIGKNTSVYQFWKRWSAACGRNEFGLVYDMLLPNGDLANRFSTAEDFFVNLNEIGLPYEPRWNLDGIKLTETGCTYLCHRTDSDDKNADIICSMMVMRRTELGYRVEKIERKVVKPSADLKLSLDIFGVESTYGAYVKKLAAGWKRPDLADESSRFVPPAE